MAYHHGRQRMVAISSMYPGSSGEWDGTQWYPVPYPQGLSHCGVPTFDHGSGRVIVTGGDGSLGNLGQLFGFSGTAWLPEPTPPGQISARTLPIGLGNGDLVLAGQSGNWRRRSGQWTFFPPPLTPSVSTSLTTGETVLEVDAARSRLVAVGRQHTMTWDGLWEIASPATLPTPRYSASLTFDAARQDTILFGGFTSLLLAFPSAPLADTWRWSGFDWVLLQPLTNPQPRFHHATAFDALRGLVVLFGGHDTSSVFDDTWTWDGIDWLLANPPTRPSARARHRMAFDAARGRTVLSGGNADNGHMMTSTLALTDTWEWDGTTWVLAATTGSPNAPIAFDGLLGRVVSFPATGPVSWSGTAWEPLAVDAPGAPPWWLVADPVRGRLLSSAGTYGPTPAAAQVYGAGCGIVAPVMQTTGRPLAGSIDYEVSIATHRASTPTFLFLGLVPASLPLVPGCAALVEPLTSISGVADSGGFTDYLLPIPASLDLRGFQVFLQAATLVNGGVFFGFDLSHGMRVTVGD